MDLSQIPKWCLKDTLLQLKPKTIKSIAESNSSFSNIVQSEFFWKSIYLKDFPPAPYKLKSIISDINYFDLYASRFSSSSNIEDHKPKVQRFSGNDVIRFRTFANSFSFNTREDIHQVVYSFTNKDCVYEEVPPIKVRNSDFLFLNMPTIISVDDELFCSHDLTTNQTTQKILPIESNPIITRIDETSFAVVTSKSGSVWDVRQDLTRKSFFNSTGNVLYLENQGTTLFVGTTNGITSHDIRNPRGPIIWNFSQHNPKFCRIDPTNGFALLGGHVVNLKSGKLVSVFEGNPLYGTILNDHISIFGGSNNESIFFDFQKGEVACIFPFGEDEKIRSISASSFNGRVAIAGDTTIRILASQETDTKFNVIPIRRVLTGSPAARKRGEISPIKEILFDGERLVTNMGSFVRLYDFFSRRK